MYTDNILKYTIFFPNYFFALIGIIFSIKKNEDYSSYSTYNKKESISTTLESVFIQTFQPVEVIVVNDGSTDGSETVVESINHPIVKMVNQSNMGVSSARNKGIEQAIGDWIAFLDADDIWLPQFLEKMKLLYDTFPECKMLASAYLVRNQEGLSKSILIKGLHFTGEFGKLDNYFEVSSTSHPPICSSAVLISRQTINSNRWFPDRCQFRRRFTDMGQRLLLNLK